MSDEMIQSPDNWRPFSTALTLQELFMIPPPSMAIHDALETMRAAKVLTAKDLDALLPPPIGVRTLGDLAAVVGRGEIKDAALAAKLKQVLNTQ
jgi:hypothetical protein